jgi:hypothetical protein
MGEHNVRKFSIAITQVLAVLAAGTANGTGGTLLVALYLAQAARLAGCLASLWGLMGCVSGLMMRVEPIFPCMVMR